MMDALLCIDCLGPLDIDILLLSHYILGSFRFSTMAIIVSRMVSTSDMHLTNIGPVRLTQLIEQPLRIGRFWVRPLTVPYDRTESLLTMALNASQTN